MILKLLLLLVKCQNNDHYLLNNKPLAQEDG
jgi:hypothetical protein